MILRGVHIYSQTSAQPGEKGLEVELDRKTGGGI